MFDSRSESIGRPSLATLLELGSNVERGSAGSLENQDNNAAQGASNHQTYNNAAVGYSVATLPDTTLPVRVDGPEPWLSIAVDDAKEEPITAERRRGQRCVAYVTREVKVRDPVLCVMGAGSTAHYVITRLSAQLQLADLSVHCKHQNLHRHHLE